MIQNKLTFMTLVHYLIQPKDNLETSIQDDVALHILFVDDVVLISKRRK